VQRRTHIATNDSAVARLIARGASEHPGIVEPPGLRARLVGCLADDAKNLEARAGDLYIASACIAGDPGALTALDARLPAIVRPALAKLGVPASDDDEIVQRVRVALLVPDERGACGLSGYTGRGELRAYLRAVAVRIALKRLEREQPPASCDPGDLAAWLPDVSDSPELVLLKQRCRDDLRAAFASALAALTARERTLLRQHHVDGLTVDRIGALHQVHRATCARWIEAARVKVLRGVRSHLRSSLELDRGELENAIALVRSELDLSLQRHLASHA